MEYKKLKIVTLLGITSFTLAFAQTKTDSSSDASLDFAESLREIEQQQQLAIAQARAALDEAKSLAEQGNLAAAERLLVDTRTLLPESSATSDVVEELLAAENDLLLAKAEAAFAAGDAAKARELLKDYQGASVRQTAKLQTSLNDPYQQSIETISPDYVARTAVINNLLVEGRAQFIHGDYVSAIETFKLVLVQDPDNNTARYYSRVINDLLRERASLDRAQTKSELLRVVSDGWKMPKVYNFGGRPDDEEEEIDPILTKLRKINIPLVTYSGRKLEDVAADLAALSLENDPEGKGVNIIVLDPANTNPEVSITLRELPLFDVLDFITRSVNFELEVDNGVVTLIKGERDGEVQGGANLKTRTFPISRATVILITGYKGGEGAPSTISVDPFAATSTGPADSGPSADEEEEKIKSFLERAGVAFESVRGSNIALVDTKLYVTQTPRNLEKVQTILRDFDDTKQVEIESKFLEVQQGALEELGVQWNINRQQSDAFFTTGDTSSIATGNEYTNSIPTGTSSNVRNLTNITDSLATSTGSVISNGVTFAIPNAAPIFPNAINLASGTGATAGFLSVFGDWNVSTAVRALEQKSGSDLMSAPKVTVLSGKTAEVTVGQEFIYPESYGDVEAEVGGGGGGTVGGGGSVAITAGTPQDFTKRVVGVQMSVTPTVEEDDKINLELNPLVTEFEGFVEYGGQSIAVNSTNIVRVPSGFFQPIFSTRSVSTAVTIFDGATIVMGGLTREEVKTVDDQVPVLGDIPFIGRLFQSKGETTQKRNLLIFVTANLLSAGGSPTRQVFDTVQPNSLFQNPLIVTPGGALPRAAKE